MEFSTRNQLRATVREVNLGSIMAEVVMDLPDGQQIVAAITRGSAEHLALKEGDSVVALVKATEVMVGK